MLFMKKIYLLILQIGVFTPLVHAQILYGTTIAGGHNDAGTIIKFIPAANNLNVAKSFETIGANPGGSLIQASNGKLYGMTANGGSGNAGVIFSLDPSSSI